MTRTLPDRRRGVAAASLLATLLLAASSPPLAGQSGSRKPDDLQQPRPIFRAGANLVRVDVYPTRDGKPVTDLTAADFEVFEDGTPQAIDAFEHVVVRPAGPQAVRREPNTIEQSRQLAANPRNRVFVLFLDVPHVTIHGAWTVREPIIRMLDRVLGEDDLVGIMTPAMAASDVVLARKTDVLAGGLRDRWPWGERHTLQRSERERLYESCYPWAETKGLVDQLIARRRERMTLEALDELVQFLGGIRDDRKAILTLTEGWLLFRPDESLTNLRTISPDGQKEPVPGTQPIGVGPDGRLGHLRRDYAGAGSSLDCDRERISLSMIDNDRYLRDIIDRANRWNATFYSVDPRGLAVWDAPIGPDRPPPPDVDYDNLRTRHESMIMLANNTDGMAVMNSNDLDRGLQRIADDLTSYYLLSYYSTNARFDGRFRRIRVAVKQPGVEVRARRGYLAPTEDEVQAARAAAAPPVPAPVAAVTSAIDALARLRPDVPFRINAVPAASGSVVWIAGELRRPVGPDAKTPEVDIQVSGGGTGAARVPLTAGQRAFVTAVRIDKGSGAEIEVKARVTGVATIPYSDVARVSAAAPPRALLFRRGPTTGNRPQPAGDPQFSRTERVIIEFPVAASTQTVTGRVLDRKAQPLNIPVAVSTRTDDTGQHWLTAEVVLAPLTIGDYAIELTLPDGGAGKEERVVTAIRVGR